MKPPLDLLPVIVTNDPITVLATVTHNSSKFQDQQNQKPVHCSFSPLITSKPFYAHLLGPLLLNVMDVETLLISQNVSAPYNIYALMVPLIQLLPRAHMGGR
jgi:hypothetical protein